MEHLIERSWYAVTETCLAFTVFRDDLSPKFVALFTLLLFLKCFHWLAEDRVDFMERSPNISLCFHIRVVSLLLLLSSLDFLNVHMAYQSTLAKGASVQLVFGFEYAILLTVATNVFIKYALHLLDLQRDNPWDEKAVYLLYTELLMGFVKVILYLTFISIMMKIHTFPLFAIRPMYLSMRAFKKALNDVVQSRRAIRNMNELYQDATVADLEAVSDNVCIICREEMVGGNGSAKKLPCNHIFHVSCLRSWFQRQQTCPTCRMDVLRATPAAATAAAAAGANANAAAPAAAAQPQVGAFNVAAFQQAFLAQLVAQQQQRLANNNNQPAAAPAGQPVPPAPAPAPTVAPNVAQQASQQPAAAPTVQPGQVPLAGMAVPMMPMMGMMGLPPMPRPPTNLSQLTIEQLREMEGTERAAIEARIRCLQDVRTLLDAAATQFRQYQMVAPTAAANTGAAITSQSTQSDANNASAASTSQSEEGTASRVNGASSPVDKEKEAIRQRRLERFSRADTDGVESRSDDDQAQASSSTTSGTSSTAKKNN